MSSKKQAKSASLHAGALVFLALYVIFDRHLFNRILGGVVFVVVAVNLVRLLRLRPQSVPVAKPESDEELTIAPDVSSASYVDVCMPPLGTDMRSASVLRWIKAVGDEVQIGEPIAEISTDFFDTEVVSPATGVIAQVVTPTGQTVPIGAVMALIQPNRAEERP